MRARCKIKPPNGKEFSWNDDTSEMTKEQIAFAGERNDILAKGRRVS